jgi:hypothetical protein
MALPSASRKVHSIAWRGSGRRPLSTSAMGSKPGPETRTTPMPPRPGAVAMAAMIPVRGCPIRPPGSARQAPTIAPVARDRERDYFFSPASTMRVICHCWAIERMLFTVQ